MINEANASSSACRLWRIPQVETGAPPSVKQIIHCQPVSVKVTTAIKTKKRNGFVSQRVLLLHANPVEAGVAGENGRVGQSVGGCGGGDVGGHDEIKARRQVGGPFKPVSLSGNT